MGSSKIQDPLCLIVWWLCIGQMFGSLLSSLLPGYLQQWGFDFGLMLPGIIGFYLWDPPQIKREDLKKEQLLCLALLCSLAFLFLGILNTTILNWFESPCAPIKVFTGPPSSNGPKIEEEILLYGVLNTAITTSFFAPLAEELCFRVFVIRGLLATKMPVAHVLLIQALLFGVFHTEPKNLGFDVSMGLMLGLICLKFPRYGLLLSIFAHSMWNLLGFLIIFWQMGG